MKASERDAFYQGSIRKILELGYAQEAKMSALCMVLWFSHTGRNARKSMSFISLLLVQLQHNKQNLQKKKLMSLIMTLLQFDYALRK